MKSNKMKTALFLVATILLGATSCQKEGCTDANATNYSDEAKKDDGSCVYASFELEQVVIGGVTYSKIAGTITEDLSLSASTKYLLSGGVFPSLIIPIFITSLFLYCFAKI
mgnify:CR=1 FL=1